MNPKDIKDAAVRTAKIIAEAEPHWVGVSRAIDFLEDFDEYTILHSGPPIEYENMCELHKRGVKNALLMERLAKDESEAEKLIFSGKVKIKSSYDFNSAASGVGIISASVPLLVCEDKKTGKRAGIFPREGRFGGGFCEWGVYSEEIRENLFHIGYNILAPLAESLGAIGGFPLRDIIAEGLTMGDENHTSQNAVDALFIRSIIPHAVECENYKEILRYFAETPRFFHNFCQAASRAALLSADGIEGSPVMVAAGGNGVEFGIKVSGLAGEWFCAPAPMIRGRYMIEDASIENQLPWIGDSSVVECAGLGGILSAASPKVCSYRNESFLAGIATTEKMRKISAGENPWYEIPLLGYSHTPVGIDVRAVAKKAILPVINGGIIDKNGGWMGAGCAKVPMQCFEQANKAFCKKYGQ